MNGRLTALEGSVEEIYLRLWRQRLCFIKIYCRTDLILIARHVGSVGLTTNVYQNIKSFPRRFPINVIYVALKTNFSELV